MDRPIRDVREIMVFISRKMARSGMDSKLSQNLRASGFN